MDTKLVRVDLRSGASEQILSGASVIQFSLSADGKQVLFAAKGSDNSSHLWLASVDHRLPPRQVLAAGDDDEPFLLDSGDIVFRQLENGAHYAYRVKADGSELRKLLTNSIIHLPSVSPDGQQLVAWVSAPNQDPPNGVYAYRLSDGTATRICDFCWPYWSADGKSFYVAFDIIAKSNSTRRGQTYVFALKSASGLPALPPGGAKSEADMAKLGKVVEAASKADDFSPGPSPDVYAFSRRTIQRNLYRVPLP